MSAEIILFRPNLITNGDFVLSIDNWTQTGTHWTWDGVGRAHHAPGSASSLVQAGILFDTVPYKVKIKVENIVAGSVQVALGTATSTSIGSDGVYEFVITSNGTDFGIKPAGTFDGDIVWVEVYYDPASASLDLNDAIVPLNYAIADIRFPDKRNSDFSKTVTLPGTKNNNIVFQQIFEIGLDGRFNPNKKARAVIYNEGVQVLKGYAQLKNIQRNQYNNVQYEVVFFGSLANIFADLGDSKLTDLDLSEYNHPYTKAVQKDSWDTQIIRNGSPYSNFFGTPTAEFVNGPPIGEGYVYPLIDYGMSTNGTTYSVSDLYPAVYAKTYIDKMFAKFGYNYTSTFLSSERFKKMVIPFNNLNLKLSAAEVAERHFRTTSTTQIATGNFAINPVSSNWTGNSGYFTVVFNNDSTTPNEDPSGQYDTSTGVFTCGNTGLYKFNVVTKGTVTTTTPVTGYGSGSFYNFQVVARIWDITNGAPIISVGGSQVYQINANLNPSGFNNTPWSTPWFTFQNPTLQATLIAGNQYRVEIKLSGGLTDGAFGTATGSGQFDWTVEADCLWEDVVVNSTLVEGDTVEMNAVIPQNVLCKDFLTSIFKMFNLYVDVDKSNEKLLYIETRDDYYNGSIIDWTSKLDVSQQIELSPMAFLEGKNYTYSYKDDADYWNDRYKKAWNETYGEYEYEVDNDFINGEVKTDLIFAPTPLVQYPIASDRVIPQIVQIDSAGNVSPKASVIRILHYSGVLSTAVGWTYFGLISGNTTETTYPYAGHLDNVNTPTFDLSFGYPRELYYSAIYYTSNNLFNIYYKKFIEEITNKDSKMVTCYLWLKPTDILTLSFRNIFYIDGHYLRLNKISDYSLTTNIPTKCEFIKIVSKAPWVDQDPIENPQGRDILVNGSFLPRPRNLSESFEGRNTFNPVGVAVEGTDNAIHISSRNGYVNGNGNRVGSNVVGFNILSSNNVTILDGLTNITVINTDDVTITESNVSYLNGIKITLSGGIVIPVTSTDAGEDVTLGYNAIKFIDTIDGGEDSILPRGSRTPEQVVDGGEE